MNEPLLQSAKREMQAIMSNRAVLIGIAAVGVVAGLAGPFGTFAVLPLLPRMIYWLILCAVTYVTGALVTSVVIRTLKGRANPVIAALIAGVIAGLVIAAEVMVINWAAFGIRPSDPAYLASMAANGIAIALVITLAGHFLDRGSETPGEDLPPALLGRLPFDKRGPLISISVDDHYVEVTTSRGKEMLLMRLSDAIAETVPTAGLQVHRSHWVALDQVAAVTRQGAKAELTLSDGRKIPVSRSNIPAVKEAGLLP